MSRPRVIWRGGLELNAAIDVRSIYDYVKSVISTFKGTEMLDPMNGDDADFLFTAHDNRGKDGTFDYYKAKNGLIFIGSIPKNLSVYYQGGYDPIPGNEAELAEIAKGDAYKVDPIRRLKPAGRYLEIGPWIGKAAYLAHTMGYEVSALELNEQCVALMRSVGINAMQTADPASKLRELRAQGCSFDSIALWHSIEHLPRPWEVLDEAINTLAPEGVLLVSAPNPESAQFRVFGKHWFHLDAPRHLYLLPIALVEKIGKRHGLEIVEATTDDVRGVVEDDHGWQWQVRRWISRIPYIRNRIPQLVGPRLQKHYRKPGTMDGAAYTVILRKPAAI